MHSLVPEDKRAVQSWNVSQMVIKHPIQGFALLAAPKKAQAAQNAAHPQQIVVVRTQGPSEKPLVVDLDAVSAALQAIKGEHDVQHLQHDILHAAC